jgi:hypothetical protein
MREWRHTEVWGTMKMWAIKHNEDDGNVRDDGRANYFWEQVDGEHSDDGMLEMMDVIEDYLLEWCDGNKLIMEMIRWWRWKWCRFSLLFLLYMFYYWVSVSFHRVSW